MPKKKAKGGNKTRGRNGIDRSRAQAARFEEARTER